MASPSTSNMWSYREGVASTDDIVGFSIEATDGDIGKVDKANNETELLPARRNGTVDLWQGLSASTARTKSST